MDLEFSCNCGRTEWCIKASRSGHEPRLECYCVDCQAFAAHLGRTDTLNDAAGTTVIQVAPARMSLTKGASNLRPFRLSPKGLLRWHTTCCNTPVGNTPANPRVAYLGLMTAAAKPGSEFGRVTARVNTHTASKPVRGHGFTRFAVRATFSLLWQRLGGGWKNSALFDDAGQPVAVPYVITREERARAYELVGGKGRSTG